MEESISLCFSLSPRPLSIPLWMKESKSSAHSFISSLSRSSLLQFFFKKKGLPTTDPRGICSGSNANSMSTSLLMGSIFFVGRCQNMLSATLWYFSVVYFSSLFSLFVCGVNTFRNECETNKAPLYTPKYEIKAILSRAPPHIAPHPTSYSIPPSHPLLHPLLHPTPYSIPHPTPYSIPPSHPLLHPTSSCFVLFFLSVLTGRGTRFVSLVLTLADATASLRTTKNWGFKAAVPG